MNDGDVRKNVNIEELQGYLERVMHNLEALQTEPTSATNEQREFIEKIEFSAKELSIYANDTDWQSENYKNPQFHYGMAFHLRSYLVSLQGYTRLLLIGYAGTLPDTHLNYLHKIDGDFQPIVEWISQYSEWVSNLKNN